MSTLGYAECRMIIIHGSLRYMCESQCRQAGRTAAAGAAEKASTTPRNASKQGKSGKSKGKFDWRRQPQVLLN